MGSYINKCGRFLNSGVTLKHDRTSRCASAVQGKLALLIAIIQYTAKCSPLIPYQGLPQEVPVRNTSEPDAVEPAIQQAKAEGCRCCLPKHTTAFAIFVQPSSAARSAASQADKTHENKSCLKEDKGSLRIWLLMILIPSNLIADGAGDTAGGGIRWGHLWRHRPEARTTICKTI